MGAPKEARVSKVQYPQIVEELRTSIRAAFREILDEMRQRVIAKFDPYRVLLCREKNYNHCE